MLGISKGHGYTLEGNAT